jgi:hypothetical protein
MILETLDGDGLVIKIVISSFLLIEKLCISGIISPLIKTEDMIEIDTTYLNKQEVINIGFTLKNLFACLMVPTK